MKWCRGRGKCYGKAPVQFVIQMLMPIMFAIIIWIGFKVLKNIN